MLVLQIHGFTPEQVLAIMKRAGGQTTPFTPFGRFVNALSRALEQNEVRTYSYGTEIRLDLDGDWRGAVSEIIEVVSRECSNQVFMVPIFPAGDGGDITIVISRPVTQGRTGQLTEQEFVQVARIAGEAHSWEEAASVADQLVPYWPILGGRSTPFVQVVKNDPNLKLPDFYDVVRAAVALRFVEDAPAIAFHLGGQSNAAATYFLKALVASGQEELARMFGETYGGRVIVDSRIIAQYGKYMPSVVVREHQEIAKWRRYARIAMLAINLLHSQGRIGDIDLPSDSPIESDQETEKYIKLLREFCSVYSRPKKERITDEFDTQSVITAATSVLGHYLYFCREYRLPPFPLAVFRSQIPSPPSMMYTVWSLMSPNDQMSLLRSARKKGVDVPVITREVKMTQIAMAASSQDREVQIAALRKALERQEVILIVDISGSMQWAIDVAREISSRFSQASESGVKTIVFGKGIVGVYGSLPSSLKAGGDTPGDPAIIICAEWARSIIGSGKRGVCAVLITDCEFNAVRADIVFGQGAYLPAGTLKRGFVVSPNKFVKVGGLYFVVVRIGSRPIPQTVSLLGEDVLLVQGSSDVNRTVTDTIKAILEVSNRARKSAISWNVSGESPGIEYVRKLYNAIVRGESPEPGITVEISEVEQ